MNHFNRLKCFEKAEQQKIENPYRVDMPWGILDSIIILLNILFKKNQTPSLYRKGRSHGK